MPNPTTSTPQADAAAQTLWMALSRAEMGSATFGPLLAQYGSPEALCAAYVAGDARLPARLRAIAPEACERELGQLSARGVQLVGWSSDYYPAQLREASSAPPLLFVRGSAALSGAAVGVAIVGTRLAETWATVAAAEIAAGLAEEGLTVISGLAQGIDAAAHQGALRPPSGQTIAVLGSSHDRIYPANHAHLAEAIIKRGGCIISDYPPGTKAEAPRLVARNRIITALSHVVIVVAALPDSGSRHAVRFAREQGRPVLAVPGSPGCDELLRTGIADPLEPPFDTQHLAAYIGSLGSLA